MDSTANALFEGIEASHVTPFVADLERRTLEPGEVLFSAGDAVEDLYLVLSGSVRAYIDQGRQPITLSAFQASSFFGELAILGGETRSASVKAIDHAVVLPISRSRFAQIAQRHPRVLDNVARVVVKSLIQTTRSLSRNSATELTLLILMTDRISDFQLRYVIDDAAAMVGRLAVVTADRWTASSQRLVEDSVAHPPVHDCSTGPWWFHLSDDDLSAQKFDHRAIAPLTALRQVCDCVVVVVSRHEISTSGSLLAAASGVFLISDQTSIASLPPGPTLWGSDKVDVSTARVEVVGVADSRAERRDIASAAMQAGLPLPSVFLPGDPHPARQQGIFSIDCLQTSDQVAQQGFLRLALAIFGTRIGIAFGAGGARGSAHLGVQRYLEELRVPVDAASGSSIGSLSAAMAVR